MLPLPVARFSPAWGECCRIEIPDPQLWWPAGYGGQPLYQVEVELSAGGTVLDIWHRRIGLRTMTVSRVKDQQGESFSHCVNGVDIFAMGMDYIPEDNLLPRVNPERTRRLRSHPSLALWCGNNEMEQFVDEGNWVRTKRQKSDYVKMYHYIIPKVLKTEDPQAFYWPSSPSSGGDFDDPGELQCGADVLLEDNYFDMNGGERRVKILRGEVRSAAARSVYDIR